MLEPEDRPGFGWAVATEGVIERVDPDHELGVCPPYEAVVTGRLAPLHAVVLRAGLWTLDGEVATGRLASLGTEAEGVAAGCPAYRPG
jgi:hypothetical protein